MSAADLPLGLIRGMSNADYHATDALGSTGLKRLAKSPAHFKGATMKKSAALSFGSLVHTLILEPGEFLKRYSVKPNDHDGRTRQGKAWMDALGSREAITHAEHDAALAMRESVLGIEEVAQYLATGEAEVSAFWEDFSGVVCKCRPDWAHKTRDGWVLLDIKTAEDASPEGFARAVAKWGYHLQAAHYVNGWQAATNERVSRFIFVAVEKEAPYAAAAYELDADSLEQGFNETRALIDLYAECKRNDKWPGYVRGIQPIALPAWARTQEEVEISYAD